ncbi:MAG: GNAT family N-acetyltransferase [Gammaproteobacteria bacterium]
MSIKQNNPATNDLLSRTVQLRLVEEDDAEFILSLRLDERYNKFLSNVGDDLDGQRRWIRQYKLDESKKEQFYFIIERLDGSQCGTVRVYDFKDDSFSWGSWILNEKKTRYAAIESALLVYKFGFESLNFSNSHFEVIKENTSVLSFHRKFGAKQISEDSSKIYFNLPLNIYLEKRKKFEKFTS